MTEDPNTQAARVVGKATARDGETLPADIEKAWEAWIAQIKQVDERAKTLLRAAFEAGYEAGAGDTTTR